MNDNAVELTRTVDRARQLKQAGQPMQAVFAWCEALALAPTRADVRMEYAALLLQAGHLDAAMEQFTTAGRHAPQDARAPLGVAMCAFQSGNYRLSTEQSIAALALQPDLATAGIYLARSKIGLNDVEGAAEALAALHVRKLNVEEANEYAVACIALGDYAHAELALVDAIRQAPDDPSLRINLALVYERKNRLEEAKTLLADVTTLDFPGMALSARLLLRNNEHQAALMQFQQLRGSVAANDHRALAEIDNGVGRCLDGMNRHAEAFGAFASCNQHDHADFMRAGQGALRTVGNYPWLRDDPTADQQRDSGWIGSVSAPAPIFLVGFPRSGTTLLDQLLDAHSGLTVAEEQPLIETAVRVMAQHGDNDQSARLNAGIDAYWQAVERLSPLRPASQLVDKFPFNLLRAQIIRGLFPDAKWIFAIRHPGDVILSCFTQRFRFTDATQGFWQLESIAALYDGTMELWLRQKTRLELNCLDLRYEDFVAAPEAHARQLIEFLGLAWQPGILATSDHAKTRWVGTPSYDQVSQPINTRAVGRWLNYLEQLEPVLPTIRRWAERLGYGDPR